ncbi:MAG: Ig-like domain-containing protein [Anaerovoracaceae bacterium]|jgi:hypothetical protein
MNKHAALPGGATGAAYSAKLETIGGKVGNYKTVKVTNVKKGAKSLKAGTTFKLKTKAVKQSKKLKVQKYRGIRYESSDPEVAAVSGSGVIKAAAKGRCTIYAYAQNGAYAKVKVTVK